MSQQEKVEYKCANCGKVSDSAGECCGQAMVKVEAPKTEGGEGQ